MDLSKLFEMQSKLDQHIIKEKLLENVELLSNTILALQVELAELAQEVQDIWKHWKSNFVRDRDKILEEYVDMLHFLLSIGLQKGWKHPATKPITKNNEIEQFNALFAMIGSFYNYKVKMNYDRVWELFLGLGKQLGFSDEDIEKAYINKNETNHLRQETNY